jgi:hypothetical protein
MSNEVVWLVFTSQSFALGCSTLTSGMTGRENSCNLFFFSVVVVVGSTDAMVLQITEEDIIIHRAKSFEQSNRTVPS